MKIPSLAECRKFVAAASGAASEAVALGLLHGQAQQWVTGALAVATAALVYALPNGKPAAAAKQPGAL